MKTNLHLSPFVVVVVAPVFVVTRFLVWFASVLLFLRVVCSVYFISLLHFIDFGFAGITVEASVDVDCDCDGDFDCVINNSLRFHAFFTPAHNSCGSASKYAMKRKEKKRKRSRKKEAKTAKVTELGQFISTRRLPPLPSLLSIPLSLTYTPLYPMCREREGEAEQQKNHLKCFALCKPCKYFLQGISLVQHALG